MALSDTSQVISAPWVGSEGPLSPSAPAASGGGGGGGAITVADGADVAQGTKADAAWVSGSGSVVSILKTIAGAGSPVKGQATMANSSPVTLASDQSSLFIKGNFSEQTGLSAASLNADLVPSTDVSGYRWWSLQILTIATGGTLTFQGSNDGTTFFSVVGEAVASSATAGVTSASGVGMWHGPIYYRYLRIRQTAYTSGSSTGVVELYTQPSAMQTMGITGAVTQSGVFTTVPNAATTGGTTPFHLVAAASTNSTSVKGSAGQVYNVTVGNVAAYPVFVKFYNKATAPTVGTDTVVKTVQCPANAVTNIPLSIGTVFSLGIGIGITKVNTDADTTAVVANDCVVDIEYK